jgi:RNA polymerase sigma factor (sigma-70 family)
MATLAGLLRRLDPVAPDPATDAIHLRNYAATGDPDALAALVLRHGPVVYRVCRRLLRPDDVEDAFQATFLVLARRAGAVRKAGSVASWLVGVAGRVAREVRRAERRRGRREAPLVGEVASGVAADVGGLERDEHARLLHEELARLPDRLRNPLVVCLLQGRTSDEAAAELGSSPRTVRRRVEQAKRVLRGRLERRGVAPVVAFVLVAAADGGTAAVPDALEHNTVGMLNDFLAGGTSPPVVLAQGVVRAMSPRKLTALIAAATFVTALGLGLAGGQPAGAVPQRPPATAVPVAAPVPEGQRGPQFYYPTRVGTRLTYRYPDADVVFVVTAVELKGDARVVTLGTVEPDGKILPFSTTEVSDTGLVMLRQGTVRFGPGAPAGRPKVQELVDRDPPHRMLKLPATTGLKWDAPISTGLPARCELQKEETVKVPAGEFRAIPVDLYVGVPRVAGKPYRFWYSRGLGPVKWETVDAGDVVLKSVTLGKE